MVDGHPRISPFFENKLRVGSPLIVVDVTWIDWEWITVRCPLFFYLVNPQSRKNWRKNSDGGIHLFRNQV